MKDHGNAEWRALSDVQPQIESLYLSEKEEREWIKGLGAHLFKPESKIAQKRRRKGAETKPAAKLTNRDRLVYLTDMIVKSDADCMIPADLSICRRWHQKLCKRLRLRPSDALFVARQETRVKNFLRARVQRMARASLRESVAA